jgi:hypothetical protein
VIATIVGVTLSMAMFQYGFKAVLLAPYTLSYLLFHKISLLFRGCRIIVFYGSETRFANMVADTVVKKALDSADKGAANDSDAVDAADGGAVPQPPNAAAASNSRIRSKQLGQA